MSIAQAVLDRILIYGLLSAPFTIFAFFGRMHWLFELCSHFRVQYLGLSILLGLLALTRKKAGIAGLMLALAGVNAGVVFFHASDKTAYAHTAPAGTTKRFLLFNLNSKNGQLKDVQEYVTQINADVVVLLELTQSISQALALKELGYEFVFERPRDDNFGIGLYSKFPMTESDVIMFGGSRVPSLATTIDFDGHRMAVIGSHPLAPGNGERSRMRDDQLKAMAAWVARDISLPTVVLMDMNTTPWSPIFTDFVSTSGLRDSRQGFGLQTTWPTWMPLLSIPIDHIFVSQDVHVLDRQTGPALGSDHLPVVAGLSITR